MFLDFDDQTNLYDADRATIRKVRQDGTVTTLVGSSVNTIYGIGGNVGLCVNSTGTVFSVSESGKIFQITPSGGQILFAGTNTGSVDGPREIAQFQWVNWNPHDMAADRLGNM